MSISSFRRSILPIVILMLVVDSVEAQKHRVFEYVMRSVPGSVDEVGAKLADAAAEAGWQVLAVNDAATPDGCEYTASVIALYNSEYARELMTKNSDTAPFAVVDRRGTPYCRRESPLDQPDCPHG